MMTEELRENDFIGMGFELVFMKPKSQLFGFLGELNLLWFLVSSHRHHQNAYHRHLSSHSPFFSCCLISLCSV